MLNDPMFEFAGRLHPMVLHLPIGLLAALVLVELAQLRRPWSKPLLLAWAAALAAVASAATGLLLQREPRYSGDTLQWHLYLGIAAAVVMVAVAAAWRRVAYRVLLILACVLMTIAGHLGASMTHGEDFLFEPFRPKPAAAPQETPLPLPVAQFMTKYCVECHGESKGKAGLRLHTVEAVQRGSKHGVVVVSAKPDESELMIRLLLDIDHDDRMPPKDKPQPSADEIEVIRSWIVGDMPPEGRAQAPAPKPTPIEPASPAAVEKLRGRLAHVEPAEPGSPLLRVDFSAVAGSIDDAAAAELLAPVAGSIADLSLARTKVTDASMGLVASMKHLKRVDLTRTSVTDAGAKVLAGSPSLREILAVKAALTADGVKSLAGVKGLEKLFVWGVSAQGEELAKIKADHAGLTLDWGERAEPKVLEREEKLTFSGDRPVPGAAPAAGAGASLKPVNTVCPVSGGAIDPKYAVVYDGKVIGFCCAKCPSQFWAEPEKYLSKLK